MKQQHPLIHTNSPSQNDILKITITYFPIEVRLLTLQIIGTITYSNTSTEFLLSVPIVLKINENILGSDNIEYYLPKDLLPTYHSTNFNITYTIILRLINEKHDYQIKKEFTVLNINYNYISIENTIVLEHDLCRVKCDKPTRLYYNTMRESIQCHNLEESSLVEKLTLIDNIIKDANMVELFKNVRYANNIEMYRIDEMLKLNTRSRKFLVQIAEVRIAEIQINDTFYTNSSNSIKIIYFKDINITKIRIKQQEKEVMRQIEYDNEILKHVLCSKYCVEKEIALFIGDESVFSLECFVFISRFVLKINFDSNEIEIPLRLVKNKIDLGKYNVKNKI